ncbi:MAG TPA: ribonuclease T2 [Xanthobacteraceae bacterium]|jgi:ribonuclease T2|nr:ribonuclease T2 [Xanthobacteraceae bacterium]
MSGCQDHFSLGLRWLRRWGETRRGRGLGRRAGSLRSITLLAWLLIGVGLALGPAAAQDRRQNQPGQFDFYVLALSWSPSFCDAAGERAAARGERAQPTAETQSGEGRRGARPSAIQQQCGERRYSFVVHGLWPQYEKGFPEFCEVPAPRLNRNIVSSMLDEMPSPRLIFREWDRHGTCSGLGPRAYFDTIRKARAVVKIPAPYLDVQSTLTVTPDEVEDAFVAANPGLTRAGVSVSCDSKRLSEVRICLTRDLGFRDCPEVGRRACRRDKLEMPPVRGG